MTVESNIKEAIKEIKSGRDKLYASAFPYGAIGRLIGVLTAIIEELELSFEHDYKGD
jgi:hypothetical protein